MISTLFLFAALAVGAHAGLWAGFAPCDYADQGIAAPQNGRIVGVFTAKSESSQVSHGDVHSVEYEQFLGMACDDGYTEKGDRYLLCGYDPDTAKTAYLAHDLLRILECKDDTDPEVSCEAVTAFT
ncbi:uncharacterized protein LOC115924480, partial [Strongylocentrotus purpuratus]|uniref:Uncharacterized protein n=1 Tax=Strongylocentrotus purpuratus TaxID=7668 RepID=A0A7M7P1M0_STRPU